MRLSINVGSCHFFPLSLVQIRFLDYLAWSTGKENFFTFVVLSPENVPYSTKNVVYVFSFLFPVRLLFLWYVKQFSYFQLRYKSTDVNLKTIFELETRHYLWQGNIAKLSAWQISETKSIFC